MIDSLQNTVQSGTDQTPVREQDPTATTAGTEMPKEVPMKHIKKHRRKKQLRVEQQKRNKRGIMITVSVLLIVLLLAFLTFLGLNYFVDPFGVFGDPIYHWDAYSMTQNPLVGKIDYLQDNQNRYNGYIFGTDGSSTYSVETLNSALNADFFDCSAQNADFSAVLKTAKYTVEHFRCNYLYLEVSPQDAVSFGTAKTNRNTKMHYLVSRKPASAFYSKYLFASPSYALAKMKAACSRNDGEIASPVCYDSQTGNYLSYLQDNVRLGSQEGYLRQNVNAFAPVAPARMESSCIANMALALADLKRICEKNNVALTVIVPPLYENKLISFNEKDLNYFYEILSQVTDYYDFGGFDDVSYDARYFYDNQHYRRCVGDMMLSCIFEDGSVYLPESFGAYMTQESTGEHHFQDMKNQVVQELEYDISVPVIRYGLISETATGEEGEVTVNQFRDQIAALTRAGYTAVLYQDLVSYVDQGKVLPEKPVVIAFDGGYSATLTLACPILEEYQQCATVAITGSNIGKNTYKDTTIAIHPHFTLYEAKNDVDSGTLELQSNTYHLWLDSRENKETDNNNGVRDGILRMEDESITEYTAVLKEDYDRMNELIRSSVGNDVLALTYPNGKYDLDSEILLHRIGIRITATEEEGINYLVRGIPQSLYDLYRVDGSGCADGVALLQRLQSLSDGFLE